MAILIVSCGKQTAPPLDLQDTDSIQTTNEIDRADLPNPQEATFAAEPEIVEESSPAERRSMVLPLILIRIKNC